MFAFLQPPASKDKCHPFQAVEIVPLIWTAVTEWQELNISPTTLISRLQTAEEEGEEETDKV